jgi:hypothetical protein
MLDLDLARLADGRDRSPDGLEGAVWSRVEALESLRRLVRMTTRVQFLALSVALVVSVALGVTIARGLAPRTPVPAIWSDGADLAPSTLLAAPHR